MKRQLVESTTLILQMVKSQFYQIRTSIPINLRIKGDDISEDTETFKVRITTSPTNAVFPREVNELEATVTITDDEPVRMRSCQHRFYCRRGCS